jgi:hypothetical protein
VNALHLAALCAFTIAQPLFDLLSRYPEFFAAHESTGLEVVAFALVLLLVPPAILLALEALAGLAHPRLRGGLHLVFVWALAALLALQAVRRIHSLGPGAVFALAALAGAAAAAAYARSAPVRSIVTVLGAAPVLFLALFLFFSPVSKITFGSEAEAYDVRAASRPPIVMVVFDAFPTAMLMDARRQIDGGRYPSFAALARDATWFRNATNVHESTVSSVPSILDGRYPRKGLIPTVDDHPGNLFTLLGSSYEMNVAEEATNLCPRGLCHSTNRRSFGGRMRLLASDVSVVYSHLVVPDRIRDELPPINDTWTGFRRRDRVEAGPKRNVLRALGGGGRPARFHRAVARIRRRPGPTLDFMHVLLPHEPLQYLPSGRQYQAGADPDPSLDGPPSYDDDWLSQQAWQRHILQVGFTDRLLGSLLRRLRQTGLYDRALIVLTADHGITFRTKPTPAPAFRPGVLGFRRELTRENVEDIAPVPLFVKLPGQRRGRIDDRHARLIDVLPTVADVLGIRLPFRTDGLSLLDPRARARERILTFVKTDGERIEVDAAALERGRRASLARQLRLFGSGAGAPGVYGIGPHRELLGRRVDELTVVDGGDLRAEVQEGDRFDSVDLRSSFVPAHVTGWLRGGEAAGRDIALALNGRIVATSRSFEPLGRFKLEFSSLVPESAFRQGPNRLEVLEVLEVLEGGARPRLALLGGAGSGTPRSAPTRR